MKSIALRQVHHGGITIQVPEIWDVETETYQEENGDESYEIDINAQGNDVRSINISFGPMPENSSGRIRLPKGRPISLTSRSSSMVSIMDSTCVFSRLISAILVFSAVIPPWASFSRNTMLS